MMPWEKKESRSRGVTSTQSTKREVVISRMNVRGERVKKGADGRDLMRRGDLTGSLSGGELGICVSDSIRLV